MATVEAVLRRRANRKARQDSRTEKTRQREQREREIAVRVARRFWGDGPVYVIVLSYAYWQARRCGWDALSAEVRGKYLDADGKTSHLFHPSESPFWLWWSNLHPGQRGKMVKASQLPINKSLSQKTDLSYPPDTRTVRLSSNFQLGAWITFDRCRTSFAPIWDM